MNTTTDEIHVSPASLDLDLADRVTHEGRDYLLLEAGSRTRTYINRDGGPTLLVVHDQ